MSSRLAILGRLGRSLGQAQASAKSESDRIPFCHAVPPQGDDQLAVVAALTHEWSSGRVEGQVNRLKLVKRAMYGRAKPDLLKARMLKAV